MTPLQAFACDMMQLGFLTEPVESWLFGMFGAIQLN